MIEKFRKHKAVFLTIIVSFIILISCYIGISFAEVDSTSDMLSGNASSLIGKTMSWSLYSSLTSKGQADCFLHTGSDVRRTVHSVYDISFDSTKGVMKVYSQVGSSKKTTYTTSSTIIASYIGKLASATSMTGNAKKVGEILKSGFGTAWLTESAINDTQSAWLDASEANYNTSLNTSYYANYKKMSQTDTNQKTESDTTVTINNVEYTIVGKFKIKFGGQGIASVTASSASWTSTSSTDIYWCTSKSTTASNWSNNFNKTSSGSYYLNNRYFYLAIRTDKLPTTGTYTVKITQNEFKYYHSRVIVTTGSAGQQTGWYAYASSPTTVNGSAEWTVKVNRTIDLTITKVDEKTGSTVQGGKFKIYAELSDGTKGWVSGEVTGDKSYVSSADSATEYTSQVAITNLKKGKYYVYETKAVDGDYGLDNQSGYKVTTNPGGTSITGDFAYLGSKDCTSSSGSVTFTAKQRAYGAIQITKYDKTTNASLTGAGFKIYVSGKGWLKGDASSAKSFVSDEDDATEYTMSSTTLTISELLYGTYYVYETSAPSDDYILSEQPGYHDTNNGEAKGTSSFESTDDWVYVGKGTVNKNTPIGSPLKVNVPNEEAPTIQIAKKDSITSAELTGAEFKIYAVLEDGTSAWLTGDADGTKSYTVTSAANATVYSAGTEISKLKYGTYYVFETKAPTTNTNYVLADQSGYMYETINGKSNGTAIPGVSTFSSSAEWAYKGSTTVSSSDAGDTIVIDITNRPEGSLQIGETPDSDNDTGKIDSITGEALTGAEFKIYAVLETTGSDGVSSGWVSGEANDGTLKQYVSYSSASTYTSGVTISRLRYGTYYIYETKAPSDDYDLREQDGYHSTNNGEAKGYTDFGEDEEWVYIGKVTINYSLVQQASTGYTLDNPYQSETVENKVKAQLTIEKVDQEYTELGLEGAEIVIYAETSSEYIENGWVTGDATGVKEYADSASGATTYTTDAEGLINLTKLNYGTYYIYETKTPEGYDITKQDGYQDTSAGSWTSSLSGDWAYLGKIEIPAGSTTEGIANGKIVPFEFTGTNIKKVNELEGLVWLDVPDTKGNTGNYLYKEDQSDQNDEELGNIEVRLYLQNDSGNYYQAATTYTANDGTYTFNFDPESSNYCGIEVTYWQLVTAYVAFIYDNTEYIAVDPFVTASNGMDITINSKAQEAEMEAAELEDENLTGTTGEYPGIAVTYQGGVAPSSLDEINAILSNNSTVVSGGATSDTLATTTLAGYYEKDESDSNHYKVSNINLGLLEQNEPSYSITESLAYAYLTINGYTYTYYYDELGTTADNLDEIPANVLKQLDAYDYQNPSSVEVNVSVYASDIISTNAQTSNMKLYLVYGIYVYNSETLTTDDIYYEEKLYLTSLTNEYDTDRMELSTDNTETGNIGADQFSLWSGSGGTVTYDLNSSSSSFSSGIAKGDTEKTYVQFQVTDTALSNLITDPDTINKWNQEQVSVTHSSGFHEYRRTDNLWNDTKTVSSRWYDDHRESSYEETNGSGDLYYIHKSETIDRDSGGLYVMLQLIEDDERKVTGTVYEEESELDDDGNKTGVGNGIIDDDENNRASGVEVTLLEISTTENTDGTVSINTDSDGNIITTTATLYALDENGDVTTIDAVTETNESGEYTLTGVVPGYYYIQYTYGDGSQVIGYIDDNGEFVEVDDLTSNDYRSTIVNTSDASTYIQEALELEDGDIISYSEILQQYYNGEISENTAQTLLEWYKQLNATNYNNAVDDISDGSNRDIMNSYTYTSQGVYDENGNLVATFTTETDDDGNITDVKLTGTNFPLEVNATSPVVAVSIENDNSKTVAVYDEYGETNTLIHRTTFSGFNLGLIKQETEIEVEKLITNASITLQQGSTVYSGNPATKSSTYISALDSYKSGSKYVKVELNEDSIYGSSVEVEYTVTITNKSATSYDSAYWFKYGKTDPNGDTESTVTIDEIVDLLDEKYVVTNLLNSENGESGTLSQVLLDSEGNKVEVSVEQEVYVETESQYEEVTSYYSSEDYTETDIYFSGFYAMTSGESVQISYRVDGLVNSDDDSAFENTVELTSLSLSGLKTVNTDFEWPWTGGGHTSDGTTIVLTPSTGGDQRSTYWIAGAIALLVVAGGLVILKKKILK